MAGVSATVLNTVLTGIVTLIVGYIAWRYRRFADRWSEAEDRRERNAVLLEGVDDAGGSLGEGVVNIVEMHDEELDHAAEKRKELEQRIDHIERRALERNGHDDGD